MKDRGIGMGNYGWKPPPWPADPLPLLARLRAYSEGSGGYADWWVGVREGHMDPRGQEGAHGFPRVHVVSGVHTPLVSRRMHVPSAQASRRRHALPKRGEVGRSELACKA